jgi:hypothetical protein
MDRSHFSAEKKRNIKRPQAGIRKSIIIASFPLGGVKEGRHSFNIVAYRPLTRQRPRNKQQPKTGWKDVFPTRSVSVVSHAIMDITTEKRCFLRGPCRRIISGAKFRA